MVRIVKGQSMLPFLETLDECVTEKVENQTLRVGDIVVYETSDNVSAVHRILNVDNEAAEVLIKGDNIPYRLRETVSFAAIKEKVVEVKRQGKVRNLKGFRAGLSAKITAFLSARDITPNLFKARFIDPILLWTTRLPVFAFARKGLYKDISFMVTRTLRRCSLNAFVKSSRSGNATLDFQKDVGVTAKSYIRYRDRNSVFAKSFLEKIVEVSDKEYGLDQEIYITDPVLSRLIGQDTASFPTRIHFDR